jgi:TRAP-type mannitol/chloroaromatic compound transport system substrate-binding protein
VGGLAAMRAPIGMLLLVLGVALSAQADRVKLRAQAGYSFNMPVLGENIAYVRDVLEAGGRDDLHVQVYDANKLVPTLQIFDAVRTGKIDAGFAWPVYWMGKLPAATVFGAVPFGPDASEYLAWMHQGGGLELWREIYARHGLVPIPCGVLPPEASGWFSYPIESEEDLRGLKIRFAGLGGEVLKRLGASVTMLASADIFPSLERGVIDATEYSMPVSPAQQSSIEMACNAGTLWTLTRGIAIQAGAVEFFEAEGVTLHRWPPELLERFRAVSDEVMTEYSESDPDFKRAWESLQAFRRRNARWSELAYPE